MRISYYLHWSGNYHVTLFNIGQRISVCPGYFRKQMNATNVIVGCCDITAETAELLGFILPAELKSDAI